MVRLDELVRVPTWDAPVGQTEASPWTRQRTVSLLTLAPSAGLSCIIIRSLEAPSASLSLSPGRLWSLAAPVVMLRQNKTNSRIDRCYGQWCVEFSSLVRGAPNPRTPALHIIEFPTVASEWLGFFFFSFSAWVENCHFARMARFSVSAQAVAQ